MPTRVVFRGGGPFYREICREVEAYLELNDVYERARRELRIKIIIQFSVLLGSWAYLIFGRPSLPAAIIALFGLLIGFLLVSFCVLHDANHGAVFRSRRSNHLLGWTSDVFLGFGSYAWRVKHNLAHHTYPNIEGYDDDISQAPLARLAPSQAFRPWYRWQHIYMWFLYTLLVLRWHVGNDILPFIRGRVGQSALPPPKRWDLVGIVAGRILFIFWAFLIPMTAYPWWLVLLAYLGVAMSAGLIMTTVFQLSHCVEEANFTTPAALMKEKRSWAVHEVESTVDFCHGRIVLTWLLGGLNYQIEHHLFPHLPHTIYPEIAGIVQRHAAKHGVRHSLLPSIGRGLMSHHRHLKEMGRKGFAAELEMG